MKRLNIFILCGCLLMSAAFFGGCGPSAQQEKEITLAPAPQPQTQESSAPVPSTAAKPDETGRPVIHFYLPIQERTSRNLCTEFRSTWSRGQDIVVLEPLAYEESVHTGRNAQYASFWMDLWNSYPKAGSCKVGYAVSLTLENGRTLEQTILSPKDTQNFFSYMEIYLYDDVHQIPGNWYSHLEEYQMTNETLITSIKLTAGKEIAQVQSASVSVFVYQDENDFDAQGRFTGTHIAKTALINTP